MSAFEMRVNGVMRSVEVDPATPLLWVLRDTLGLTGTKFGCGTGLCGACTVHLSGEAVRSCSTSIREVGKREVTTIEGLAENPRHPILRAWIADEVPQCGYCQPGQIMQAAALLARHPRPSDAQIDTAMSAVLCRCGTYQRIRRAIQHAAQDGSRR